MVCFSCQAPVCNACTFNQESFHSPYQKTVLEDMPVIKFLALILWTNVEIAAESNIMVNIYSLFPIS